MYFIVLYLIFISSSFSTHYLGHIITNLPGVTVSLGKEFQVFYVKLDAVLKITKYLTSSSSSASFPALAINLLCEMKLKYMY